MKFFWSQTLNIHIPGRVVYNLYWKEAMKAGKGGKDIRQYVLLYITLQAVS